MGHNVIKCKVTVKYSKPEIKQNKYSDKNGTIRRNLKDYDLMCEFIFF